jgi:predicted DCC family thiol-disulfide oxidoreductase YuxK
MPAPLLIAYDPDCSLCFRMALWLARRDRRGLLLVAPLRDPEVLALAPELAGRDLAREIHGLDLGTRRIWTGADLLGPIARRLPAWAWAVPLLGIPGMTGLVRRLYLGWSAWRFRRSGRLPFRDG